MRVEDAHEAAPSVVVRCVFCDRPLRWVHVLVHERYPDPVPAGRCCAARVCGAYDAAYAERRFRYRLDRRARFADPRGWRTSRTNPANVWRTVQLPGARVRVVLFVRPGGRHGVMVIDLSARDERVFLPGSYPDRRAAAVAAFEVIDAVTNDPEGETSGRAE